MTDSEWMSDTSSAVSRTGRDECKANLSNKKKQGK